MTERPIDVVIDAGDAAACRRSNRMKSGDLRSIAGFAAALEQVKGIALPPDRAARLQFDVGRTGWFVVVEGGRVTEWENGSLTDSDVAVRWDFDAGRRILTRALRGDEALRATTVTADAGGTAYSGPPAPTDLGSRPELELLPVVPGATFRVQYRYRGGPFGDVQHVLAFENGRLAAEGLGAIDNPDIEVDVTYRSMALLRCGEISIIEALEGGSVQGAMGPLAALAGITESDEFHAAELATGRHALALAVLGELDANPTFAAAQRLLAAALDDDHDART